MQIFTIFNVNPCANAAKDNQPFRAQNDSFLRKETNMDQGLFESRIMIMRNPKSDAEYLLKEALSESLAFGCAMKSCLIAKELSKLR